MRERYSLEGLQTSLLLPGGFKLKGDDEKSHKIEYELRTGWVIVGSVMTVFLMFFAMITYTRTFIFQPVDVQFVSPSEDFRRSSSDYVLNSGWNVKAKSTVREFKWTVTSQVANPNGVYRQIIAINGKYPGPPIECNEGDTLLFRMENQSADDVVIHFTGIHQNGKTFQDEFSHGVRGEIASKRNVVIEFTINGQSGTYTYHLHQGTQSSDGIFGPLIIHSKNEKTLQSPTYTTDRVLMLQPFHHSADSLPSAPSAPAIHTTSSLNSPNIPNCDLTPDHLCTSLSTQAPTLLLPSSATHRLRLLNLATTAHFSITIDAHNLTVIEVNGTPLSPSTHTEIQLAPGQSLSAIVTTASQTADSGFWLRTRMLPCGENRKSAGLGALNAWVSYGGDSVLGMDARVLNRYHFTDNSAVEDVGDECFDMAPSLLAANAVET